MPQLPAEPDQVKRWITFLRNHKDDIAAMVLFTVPTVSLRLLYGFSPFGLIMMSDKPIPMGLNQSDARASSAIGQCTSGKGCRILSAGVHIACGHHIGIIGAISRNCASLCRFTPSVFYSSPCIF